MARPRCSAFVAASLDGFIARPDGAVDWLGRVNAAGEDHGYRRFFDDVDAILVGRRTWEVVLDLGTPWPYEGKRVYVLTHATPAARHGEVFLASAPGAVLERLAADGVRRVYVDGGAVVSSFLRAGLLDDLTVSIVPIVLGDGIRLFQEPLPERALALEGAQAYASGLVQLRYRVVGTAPSP